MKIWIDALTPKQALFFNVIRGWLTERGHDVFSTTRAGYGASMLGSIIEYDLVVVGRHGATRYEKLLESSKRVGELSEMVYDKKFDVALSFSSPECARVSYGLGIPHVSFNDSPHAVHASRLTIPLSRMLFTPWIIPKRVWTPYGIGEESIVQYKAIDASIWLRSWPFKDMRKELHLKDEPVIMIRMHEELASYLLEGGGNVMDIIRRVAREYSGRANIVILSRYGNRYSSLRKEFGENITVLDSAVDGPSLIKSSDVFIGMGGTMSHEAALLGVPAISAYPGKATLIERFLMKRKLVFRPNSMRKLVKTLDYFLQDKRVKAVFERRATDLWNMMENPREKIISRIETIGKKV
ncbi:MAG: DUF354 domain-containing protein [Nitrososphaeria archaeon]